MTIGLISDTHGYVGKDVIEALQGVDHILHAGDVGSPSVILELEAICPVTAVLGNTDDDPGLREFEVETLNDQRFYLQHIVDPKALSQELRERTGRIKPDFVIYGHTHRQHASIENGIHFINPGYAGRPKSGQKRTITLLDVQSNLQIVPLSSV